MVLVMNLVGSDIIPIITDYANSYINCDSYINCEVACVLGFAFLFCWKNFIAQPKIGEKQKDLGLEPSRFRAFTIWSMCMLLMG